MKMPPDSSGCAGTREFENLTTDSLVLAVGRDAELEPLCGVPDLAATPDGTVTVDAHMATGHPALSRRFLLSLAAVRGVETHEEVVKYLLVGADVVMTASALLRHGPEHMRALVSGLENWLEVNRFDAVSRIRGLRDGSRGHDASEFLRSQYVRLQQDFSAYTRQG